LAGEAKRGLSRLRIEGRYRDPGHRGAPRIWSALGRHPKARSDQRTVMAGEERSRPVGSVRCARQIGGGGGGRQGDPGRREAGCRTVRQATRRLGGVLGGDRQGAAGMDGLGLPSRRSVRSAGLDRLGSIALGAMGVDGGAGEEQRFQVTRGLIVVGQVACGGLLRPRQRLAWQARWCEGDGEPRGKVPLGMAGVVGHRGDGWHRGRPRSATLLVASQERRGTAGEVGAEWIVSVHQG
jgi:hypothetical protein